ncbi:thioesterase family protein [Denitrobaculum tricleocarpae]|uniref:Thioesterase-like protein n=1 Tax=Denitrobaculum tricleocarpae TaxID=2591009 RepID=A0A545T0S3_9PROT|nr:thioesterase family protein [Denitrobaculum tricleocarpae]TQV70812.1 thioesterase-like protein [Denitrobaculum tricleocarpae]
MEIEAPFDQHRTEVLPEWIDVNGHMNVAYYVLAFDHATDLFFDYIGLDDAYREQTGGSTFAVESYVTYQREVMLGDPLRITTQLLAYDPKRLHFFHQMYHAREGYLAATSEWLNLHIDLNIRRVAPMPEPIQRRLAAIWAKHETLDIPKEAGRSVRGIDRPE